MFSIICLAILTVDVNLYSFITPQDYVLDYNLTLDDCVNLLHTTDIDAACYLQPEGEI